MLVSGNIGRMEKNMETALLYIWVILGLRLAPGTVSAKSADDRASRGNGKADPGLLTGKWRQR